VDVALESGDDGPSATAPVIAPIPECHHREGWYADPRVEPIQSRWWDGTQWTSKTRGSKNYGFSMPVRNRATRYWNRAVWVLSFLPIAFGTALLARHLVGAVGDPATVYVTQLARSENPKIVIARHCPSSVVRVKHYVDYVSAANQEWSVVPTPGHLAVAYFNVNNGDVTCP
jgi:hypothetical protein